MNMLICHSGKFRVFNCDAKTAVEETHTVCSCCRISRFGCAENGGGGVGERQFRNVNTENKPFENRSVCFWRLKKTLKITRRRFFFIHLFSHRFL